MKESNEYMLAEGLVIKFYLARGKRPLISFWRDTNYAKRCAIVAIDEMINALYTAGITEGLQIECYKAMKLEIPRVGI